MRTLADLAGPLATLRLLAAEHPELPAPTIAVSPIYPSVLTLALHDSYADFEAWRKALGINPDAVDRQLQSGDTVAVLKARRLYADATVELVGYGPNLPVATADRSLAVAA